MCLAVPVRVDELLPGAMARVSLDGVGMTVLGVEARIILTQHQAAGRNLAQPAPFKGVSQHEHLCNRVLGFQVTLFGHRAEILVLDLGAVVVHLAHQHQHRLHHIERLETGNHHRAVTRTQSRATASKTCCRRRCG